jgi:hypothetical protein
MTEQCSLSIVKSVPVARASYLAAAAAGAQSPQTGKREVLLSTAASASLVG